MNEEFKPTNSYEIQMESLINFAAALGYEAVFDLTGKQLLRFKQPAFRKHGQEYMSVKRAIKLHNVAPLDVWNYTGTLNCDFNTFLNTPGGEDMVTMLFAGSVRIIETVKAQYKKGVGFHLHPSDSNLMVKFLTKKDEKQYGHFFMED